MKPHVKHSPELAGAVPGWSGKGLDSETQVPTPCIINQSACCAAWACCPASVSGCCKYFWSCRQRAVLSACVGGGHLAMGLSIVCIGRTGFACPPPVADCRGNVIGVVA